MARKKHEEEHENHERWLVSYADFITLLFAFFTVLYATSQKDVDKAKDFEKSVKKAFGIVLSFGGQPGDNDVFEDKGSLIPPPWSFIRRRHKTWRSGFAMISKKTCRLKSTKISSRMFGKLP